MNEYRMANCDIAIRCDATIDDIIDVIEAKSRSYIPVVYALNKIDAISIEELDLLYRIPNACPISSEHGWNVDELMEQMWEKLELKRIYTKPKGRMPDYTAPSCSERPRGRSRTSVRHPQDHRRTVQNCDCLRQEREAPAAKSRIVAYPRRRRYHHHH